MGNYYIERSRAEISIQSVLIASYHLLSKVRNPSSTVKIICNLLEMHILDIFPDMLNQKLGVRSSNLFITTALKSFM